MFQAAQLIGRAIRRVRAIEKDGFEAASIRFSISLLFGGQIGNGEMRLYLIYSAGNFIECSTDAPSFRSASTSTASRSSTGR